MQTKRPLSPAVHLVGNDQLSKGEGWGGKETTAPCKADVLALARGQWLQGYMAL